MLFMTEGELFTFLYPVVPLIGLMGFLPQIFTLIKITEAPNTISVSTWSIWTMTWLISFGYAVFAMHDTLFAVTCGMNLVGHILIIALTIYKRNKYDPVTKSMVVAN